MMPPARPPRLAQWLIIQCAPVQVREHLLGDLDEKFVIDSARLTRFRASLRYWRQALASAWHWPPALSSSSRRRHRIQEPAMSFILNDLRFSVRQLLRRPSFAGIVILSLALSVAANGVVFGLVNGLVLNPFNYPDGARLITIGGAFPPETPEVNYIEQHSPGEVEDLASLPGIEKLGAWDLGNRVLSDGGAGERLFTALILRDPLPALGVPMALGRSFTPEELAPGGASVAIISHRVWLRMFGGDRSILGRTVTINTDAATIVGVLGPATPLIGTDLWIPWGIDPAGFKRNLRQCTVLARLRDGVTLDDVNRTLGTVSARAKAAYASEFPEYADWKLVATPWSEAVIGELRSAAPILLAAGGIVLLIACANVASLMLARLATRQQELSVRRALGASTSRLTGGLVLESFLLASIGALAGMGLAAVAVRQLPLLLPPQAAQLGLHIPWDVSSAIYCAVAGIVSAVLAAAIPAFAMRNARATPPGDATRGAPAAVRHRGRRILITAEVALAAVLLVTAGLFVRSYGKIGRIEPGFDPGHLLTMRLTIDPKRYPSDAAAAFFTDLVERLQTLPGVVGVTATNQLPTMTGFTVPMVVAGATETERPNTVLLTVSSPQRARILGTPLRSGRDLTERDQAKSPPVVLVNEAFSRRYLGGAGTGRILVGSQRTPAEIVGVLADAANRSLIGPAEPEMFATMEQAGEGNNQYFLAIRASGDPLALLPGVRRVVAQNNSAPVYMVQTMDQVIATEVFPQRLAMVLVGVFAVGALVAALIGVYGLVSHWVVSRNREMGIRIALGGSRRQVVGLVVTQAVRLVGWGAAAGLLGGVGAGFAAASLLFDTSPTDPITLIAVAGLLCLVAVFAAFAPARRAVSVNPIDVLRAD